MSDRTAGRALVRVAAVVVGCATASVMALTPCTAGAAVATHATGPVAGPHLSRGPIVTRPVFTHPHRHLTAATSYSYNWAGYAQNLRAGQARSTSATFTVPTIKPGSGVGYASTWVGIDGLSNGYLAQTGIEEDATSTTQTHYQAWWEVITPTRELPEQRMALPVAPGQRISASVSISAGYATMTLINQTTRYYQQVRYPYAGPGASDEFIQEDVDVNGTISPAPNWGAVTFTGATRNGAPAGLTTTQSLDIIDSHSTVETITSRPNATGNGFTTTWRNHGTPTPLN